MDEVANSADYSNPYVEYDEDDPVPFNYTDTEPWNCYYWNELLPPLVVYSLTMVLGVTGNVLIVFTTCLYRRMKSPTNVFLASLASADLLLIVICIPVKVAKLFSFTWTMGLFLCKFVHYMQTVVAVCSVLTLMAISIERCALRFKTILSVAAHMEVGENIEAYYCTYNYDNPFELKLYVVYMMLLIFIIPTSVMMITYSTICWEIWQVMKQRHHMVSGRAVLKPENIPLTNKSQNGNQNGSVTTNLPPSNDDKGNVKQVIKMLVLIVVVFVICWAPILVWETLIAFDVVPEFGTGIYKHTRTTFHLMAYANSCINPIIYGFMSKNFRESFQKALGRCCRRNVRRQLSMSHSRGTSIRKDRSTVTTLVTINS